ncbi:hypothetical protein [Moorena sp. SIO4E2]|uniref:hypothetical protein n=1 Tax=Moorena sp. SIO4E2 TaxID=2607826 RepID=UPI00257C5CFD|nr:hypothetical protein [Moorena sp. SIO4E2]
MRYAHATRTAVSGQPSAVSRQPSAVSRQLILFKSTALRARCANSSLRSTGFDAWTDN